MIADGAHLSDGNGRGASASRVLGADAAVEDSNSGDGELLVDPAVPQVKFEREIGSYRSMEHDYRKRGWFLVRAEYPEVLVLMVARQLRPPSIQYAMRLDFTDYDLVAPSLRFVDPFTGVTLQQNQVSGIHQKRTVGPGGPNVDAAAPLTRVGAGGDGGDAAAVPPVPPGAVGPVQIGNLVQGHEGHHAFLCVPGTREYHDHPYHSNDPWLAHRGTGVGTLHYLLNVIWQNGIVPMTGYSVRFNVQIGPPQVDHNRIP